MVHDLSSARGVIAAFDTFSDIAVGIHEAEAEGAAILELIAQSAARLLETDIAWLVLADADSGMAQAVVVVGFRSERFLRLTLPSGEGVTGEACLRRSSIVLEDYRVYEHRTSDEVRQAIHEEGIISLICSPMFKGDQFIGALFVGRRRPSAFRPEQTRLLEALAGQASVAIENQKLYSRLQEQNRLLERSLDIHRQFTEAGLAGVGLDGIAQILFGLVHHPVRITPYLPLSTEVHFPPASEPGATGHVTTLMIAAEGHDIGRLELFHDEPLNDLDMKALQHARTMCGLELVKLNFAMQVEQRFSSRLLDDLLAVTDAEYSEFEARGRHFNLDLRQPFRVIVVRFDVGAAVSDRLEAALRQVLHHELGSKRLAGLVSIRAGMLVAAIPAEFEERVELIVAELEEQMASTGMSGTIGVGPLSPDIRASHVAADACSLLGRRSAGRAVARIHYDDLGLMKFMLNAPNVEFIEQGARERLAPLLAHDRTSTISLTATLRAYLETNGHHAQTARALYIGVTTLKYRLGRISEVMGGIDLSDPRTRFELRLALEMLRFLEAIRST